MQKRNDDGRMAARCFQDSCSALRRKNAEENAAER
jgi:hypothetical protein